MRKNALLSFLGFAIARAVDFTPLDDKPGLIDNGTFGPTVEVVHLFLDQPPIGITVGPNGRAFVTFNRCVCSEKYTFVAFTQTPALAEAILRPIR